MSDNEHNNKNPLPLETEGTEGVAEKQDEILRSGTASLRSAGASPQNDGGVNQQPPPFPQGQNYQPYNYGPQFQPPPYNPQFPQGQQQYWQPPYNPQYPPYGQGQYYPPPFPQGQPIDGQQPPQHQSPITKPVCFDTQTGRPIYGYDRQTGQPLFQPPQFQPQPQYFQPDRQPPTADGQPPQFRQPPYGQYQPYPQYPNQPYAQPYYFAPPPPKPKLRKPFSERGLLRPINGALALIIAFGIVMVISFMLAFAVIFFNMMRVPITDGLEFGLSFVFTVIMHGLLIGFYFVFMKVMKQKPLKTVGLRKSPEPDKTLFTGLIMPVLVVAAMAATTLAIVSYGNLLERLQTYLVELAGGSALPVVPEQPAETTWFGMLIGFFMSVLFFAVMPSISEELLFRGIVLNSLRKWGTVPAVLISSFLFMLFHTNPEQVIHQFVLGVVLAYAVIRTKSLWIGMLGHFINNFLAILMGYLDVDPYGLVKNMTVAHSLGFILIIVFLVGAVFAVDALTKNIKNNFIVRLFIKNPVTNKKMLDAEDLGYRKGYFCTVRAHYALRGSEPYAAEKKSGKVAIALYCVVGAVFAFMWLSVFFSPVLDVLLAGLPG